MDREKLRQLILKVRDWRDYNFNEDQVKGSIIDPIFNNLGWDTTNPDEVKYEYPLTEGKVDYAFFANSGPLIFVEAKACKVSLEHYKGQLLKYAYSKGGVQLAVLTNGLEWWLYLPWEVEKDWDERKFYSVDLAKQDVETICDMLNSFLGKENVLSGDAVREAKNMRKSTERNAKIKKALPKVWNEIVTEPHDKLINLLMEETEGDCGFKPDEVKVKDFIQRNRQHLILTDQPPPPTGEKKARYYGEDRKPKIPVRQHKTKTIDGMTIELLKEGPKTPEELVEIIVKEKPNKDPNVLLHTTIRRLRGYLHNKFGVNIEKDDNGRYFIK